MSCQLYVNNLIAQNDWKSLEIFLKSEQGHIGKSTGGRYSTSSYGEEDGFTDINQVCWSVFYASHSESFKFLPIADHLAASRVIKELRRLYDETEVALAQASYIEAIATRVYDLSEALIDGFQPIGRLENCVLSGLDSIV